MPLSLFKFYLYNAHSQRLERSAVWFVVNDTLFTKSRQIISLLHNFIKQ